jgi:hypothetical protein
LNSASADEPVQPQDAKKTVESPNSSQQQDSQQQDVLQESQQENPLDQENSQDSIFGGQDPNFDLAMIAAVTATEKWISPKRFQRKPQQQRSPPNKPTWKINYPPRFLADIGLHSLFITIQKQENFQGPWDSHTILTEMYPYLHARNHICDLVPVEWKTSPSTGYRDLKTTHLDSYTPPYIITQDKSNAFGVRFLTSIATASSLRSFLTLWPRLQNKEISLRQPEILPPTDLNFQSYQPDTAYLKAGWLFLSTEFVPILELQCNIILELYKIHPEYRWLHDPIKVVNGRASKIIDLSITDVSDAPIADAPCLWLLHHPDIPHTIIQPFLRNLFTREVINRPLSRPMIFMPYSFQATTKLVRTWNTLIPI